MQAWEMDGCAKHWQRRPEQHVYHTMPRSHTHTQSSLSRPSSSAEAKLRATHNTSCWECVWQCGALGFLMWLMNDDKMEWSAYLCEKRWRLSEQIRGLLKSKVKAQSLVRHFDGQIVFQIIKDGVCEDSNYIMRKKTLLLEYFPIQN